MAAFVGVHTSARNAGFSYLSCGSGQGAGREAFLTRAFIAAPSVRACVRACVCACVCVCVLPPPSLLPLAVVQEVCE